MKKRLLTSVLSLVMILALLPTATLAASAAQEDTWDGTVDISWYREGENDFKITTAEQLAGLAQLVNTGNKFEDKTVSLGSNLNLAGHEWTSIGTGSNAKQYFGGTFDGQHFQIRNLTSKNSTTYYHGLFGVISNGGTVQNLYVVDADLYSNDNSLRMGILADWVNDGTVKNCYTSGTAHNVSGNKLLGGLIGTCTAGSKIIGCSSDAKVISDYYNDGDEYSDCDTVGGIVGQWENATSDAIISDCWFGGSISCEFPDSGVGGILGANFDFYDEDPGVTIQNCMVVTRELYSGEPGNITWIAAVVHGSVENCLWPDSPPDGVSLEGEDYADYNGNYLAVVSLVVDGTAGTASANPDFDQTDCGLEVASFADQSVLEKLQNNAGENIQWVAGDEHPVFQRQEAIVLLEDTIEEIARSTEWQVSQEDANDADSIKGIIETKLRDLNLDTSFTVTVGAVTPAADGRDGNFALTIELGKNGVSRFVEVTDGIIRATPLVQKAPDFQPELKDRTTNSITLNAVEELSTHGASVEYGISSDGGATWTWQSNPEFTELSPGTTYMFALRYEAVNGDTSYGASENGPAASFSTSSIPSVSNPATYAITVPSDVTGGEVSVSPSRAERGDTVTITVTPDEGYELDELTVTDANGNRISLTDAGNGRYTFTMPRSRVTVEATFAEIVEEPTLVFVDVPAGEYYYDAVYWAVENGITYGTTDTTFTPERTVTRAEMVTFLWRAHGSPVPESTVNPFTDVSSSAYYYDAVLWAVENSVTHGTSATTFSPDATVTRAQAVTFQWRAAGSPAVSGGSFADVEADAYYADAVTWAVANSVTNGTSGTTFSPEVGVSRAQAVTFLYRQLG